MIQEAGFPVREISPEPERLKPKKRQ